MVARAITTCIVLSCGIQCGIVQQSHSKVNDAIQSTYMYEQQPTYIYHLNTQNTPSSAVTTPTKPFTQNNKNQRTREEGPADRQCKTHQGEPASQAQSSTTSPSNRHSLNIPTIAKNETRTKNSKRKEEKKTRTLRNARATHSFVINQQR